MINVCFHGYFYHLNILGGINLIADSRKVKGNEKRERRDDNGGYSNKVT